MGGGKMNIKILLSVLTLSFGYCFAQGHSEIEYREWKESIESNTAQQRRNRLMPRLDVLIDHIKDWADFRQNSSMETSDESAREILFAYNSIRELLFQSMAADSSEIDFQWLQEVETAVVKFRARRRYKFESPSQAQKDLIRSESSKILGPEHTVIPFSLRTIEDGEACHMKDRPVIAIGKSVDLDYRLAAVYHELGHIVHKDDQFLSSKSFNDEEKLDEFLQSPEVQKDLERIEAYCALGRRRLGKNSSTGKNINALLAKNPTLWIPPRKRMKYKKMLVYRATEQRADLFMLDKLFEQGHITPLLRDLETYSLSDFVTALRSQTVHPSDLERALSIAGFLFDKKVRLNKVLKEWDNTGVCIPAEPYNKRGKFIHADESITQGEKDLLRAQEHHSKKMQARDREMVTVKAMPAIALNLVLIFALR